MEVRRTAAVKLAVPDERRDDLHESARQFLYCANRASEFCWDDTSYKNCITANTTARNALYKELRAETDLSKSRSRIHPTCRAVEAKQVAPNHTSQRCSRTDCGFTHEDNRDGEHFHCLKCGYEVNADYNAAKNIGLRSARKRHHRLRSSPKSGSVDAPVDVCVNGGMVNAKSHRPIAGD